MDLKEKLKDTLKTRYGIETDNELMDAIEEISGIDLGIFVSPMKKKENIA